MAVGDVNSDKPGSGARYNDGKLQMDLIPVRYWLDIWYQQDALHIDSAEAWALECLSAFQMGDDLAIADYMSNLTSPAMEAACKVLEYGAKKYAAWNWAKGMDWSVPTGCALRHARAIIEGETQDPESGESHQGHIDCNMLMLAWFLNNYPEGDNRPPTRKV